MKKFLVCTISLILFLNIQSVFADNIKTLYFSSIDNKLYYDAKMSPNTDYFMVFEDMVANKVYEDQLKIRNDASEEYDLLFQIIPKDEMNPLSRNLLKAIDMKISYDNELLYEGSADAVTKKGGLDVSEMVSLGRYKQGDEKTLHVEIKLNHKEPLVTKGCYYVTSEYELWQDAGFAKNVEPTSYPSQEEASAAATKTENGSITYHENTLGDKDSEESLWGAFAETTWRFYAQNDDEIIPIRPDTGDTTNKDQYVIYTIIALAILIVVGVSIRRNKEEVNA